MAFAGLRGTGDWGTDERPKNFRERILWLDPNGMTPLTGLMSMMGKESTDDPEFAWWEETLTNVRLQVNGALEKTSTTFTVNDGGLLALPGDIFMLEKVTNAATYDNELVVVSSVTNDTTFVVKRGQSGTATTIVSDDTFMTRIGTVFEEGTRSPDVTNRNPVKLFNYVQDFRKAVEITDIAEKTKARTGSAWANDKKRKAFDHAIDQEYGFLWGKKSEVAAGPTKGKPIRTTGGLASFLTTNYSVFTTTPSEDDFIDFMAPLFNYSADGAGDERLVLAGNGFMTSLNRMVRDATNTRINFEENIKVYGMRIARWILPMGTLGFKTHPLFNIHPEWNYDAFVINPKGIILRTMFDTYFKDNVQENDATSHKAFWRTVAGLEVHHESTMGIMRNFRV